MAKTKRCPLIIQVLRDDMRRRLIAKVPEIDRKLLNVLVKVETMRIVKHYEYMEAMGEMYKDSFKAFEATITGEDAP